MAQKRIQRTIYLIEQRMENQYFNGTWNDTTTIDSYINDFVKRFNAGQSQQVKHFAIIVHDKDEHIIHGKTINKVKHFHGYLEFDKKVDLSTVAKYLGIEEQYVDVLQKGRYAKNNALAYMIHAKQPEKYQYSDTEVYSDGSTPLQGTYGWTGGWYNDIYAEHAEEWANQLATGKQQHRKLSLDKVLDEILDGKITMNNVLLTDDLLKLYARNMSKFKDAFQARAELQSTKIAELIKSGDINVEAYYIWGKSGVGKTYLLDTIQENIEKMTGQKPHWFKASADHPFDNYSGEPYILLDDVGAKALSVKDWLHLLDPHHIYEFGASRYHNKPIAAHTIFITSTDSPTEYFNRLMDIANGSEPIEQVFRRLWSIIHIEKIDDKKTIATIEKHPKDDPIKLEETAKIDYEQLPDIFANHIVKTDEKVQKKLNENNQD